MSSKVRLRGQALKDANHAISILREKGLYSGKAARGQPTRYALSQIKKYEDVVRGRASVVTAPSRSAAKQAAGKSLQTKGRKVVVPVNKAAGEKARFSKTSNEINKYGINRELRKYRRTVGKFRSTDPQIPGATYILPAYRGQRLIERRWTSKVQMTRDMSVASFATWVDWENYVEIEEPI